MISDDSIERKLLRGNGYIRIILLNENPYGVMDDIRMILLKENPSGVMDVFGLFY